MASGYANQLSDATTLAVELTAEIARRWPSQAGRWKQDGELVASWGSAILSANARADELGAALERLSARPFPPDLGALLAAVEDAREQHRRDLLRRPCLPPPLPSAAEWERNRQRIREIRERFFSARTPGA